MSADETTDEFGTFLDIVARELELLAKALREGKAYITTDLNGESKKELKKINYAVRYTTRPNSDIFSVFIQ